MNRRSFLIRGGTAGVAAALPGSSRSVGEPATAALLVSGSARSVRFGARELAVPDEGWHLWLDREAVWQDDAIFLPEDVRLSELPVNAPTGGWAALHAKGSLPVTLPSTVEQFFWGSAGRGSELRPYKDEYKFEATDDEVKNGAYYGVSWWWRDLNLPKGWVGKRILLHVRAARQRAEVYLNGKLVGYSIMEELPFECDLTAAARGGVNRLAIRITNPGGRLDWVDANRLSWGGLQIQKSHGFGGLDRGMVLSAHGSVRFQDLWVLNTPDARTVRVHAQVENASGTEHRGHVRFEVLSADGRSRLASQQVEANLDARGTHTAMCEVHVPEAELWDLATPHVYRMRAEWIRTGGEEPGTKEQSSNDTAVRETDFGFRWITTDGLGTNAVIRLNGRRIRIYTSISWSFWALNGLFPTPELAEKEVRVAKSLNLNTLNFHRNLGKEDVLYVQDRLGLMRCLEPGGGSQSFLPNPGPHDSARRYMRAKIQGMVRAFRSHPSVVHYILQNEVNLDPNSPELAEVFALLQKEDPSRTIVGNDGFVLRSPQAWTEPYSTAIHKSGPKATREGGAAGWWVDHTGQFSDVWQDSYYKSPQDFYYYSPVRAEIVEWGEMKGAAAPDNHVSVLRQIQAHGGFSYDKVDHQEQLAAYEHFLDRWGFRAAFPSTEKLFLSIGRRAYESWGQFLENVRLCEQNDMAAISGWESTAMENHSGLVDNFRDLKSDPRPLQRSLLPVRPVAKQRQIVLFTGQAATLDVFLLNDSNAPVTGELKLTLTEPTGKFSTVATYPAPQFVKDQLTYLLREGVQTPALTTAGTWRTHLSLAGKPDVTHEVELLVIDPAPAGMRKLRVGMASVAPAVEAVLKQIPQAVLLPFRAGEHYDVIVASGGAQAASKDVATDPEGAYKPGAGPLQEFTLSSEVLAAVRAGTPLLAVTPTDGQSVGVAKQLAAAGAFQYHGMVGPSRASWMGSWYFIRRHALYDGLPVDQAMSIHYQVKGGGSNGWRVDGDGVEIVAAYGRDHDRNLGAGTLTAKVGSTPLVLHRMADMHPVMLTRFVANAMHWLAGEHAA